MTELLSSPAEHRLASSPGGRRAASAVRTTVVLDTSVLIADPDCLTGFGNADVVIPIMVIEELDGLKTRLDDVGRAARSALRAVEELRVSAGGSLADPTPVDGAMSATVRIDVTSRWGELFAEHGLEPRTPDNRIIASALHQAERHLTTLVSNDAALRIKAAHLGVTAREHQPSGAVRDSKHPGWKTIESDEQTIDALYRDGRAPVDDALTDQENSFAVMRCGSQSALVRRRGARWELLGPPGEAWGLRPRSKEQRFALDLLLDPTVSVVALDGQAGTGKTLVAIAAGLEQVVERRMYERLAVYRPLVPVGRADVGFLPGGLDEKLDPWMSAIHDAIVALTDRRSDRDAQHLVDELVGRSQLTLESVTFLRGRSLHRQFVVVDEAQNLEPTTLKTVLTRIGEDTKVVFTGDTSQIDAPYLGESNNALAVLIQAFRGHSCFGNVTLAACERGEVARLAAELL